MTQAELIGAIAEKAGQSKAEVARFLEALVDNVTAELVQGGELRLSGLGTFSVKTHAATTGRNPRTGAAIEIPEKRAVKLSPAKALKDALNPVPAQRRKRA